MRKHPTLSWVPVRRGRVYCAPACGRGCTWAEYVAAKREAEHCLWRMDNPSRWRIRIHENLGWHWNLVHKYGYISVYSSPIGFSAMLSSTKTSGACDGIWFDDARFEDPNDAVRHRIYMAKKYVEHISAVVERSEKL